MEPEDKYYQPFIKPLLDQSNSAYRYTKLSGAHPTSYWSTYDEIFNDELLPKREHLKMDDPRLRQTDRSLLVTGTLFRSYALTGGLTGRVNYANMLLSQFAIASQNNTLFHHAGLVRMLLWLPQDIQRSFLPPGMFARSGLSTATEMAVDMTEVAGPPRESSTTLAQVVRDVGGRRYKDLKFRLTRQDHFISDQVAQRMEENKRQLPPHRRSKEHQESIDRCASGQEATRMHDWNTDVLEKLSLHALSQEIETLEIDSAEYQAALMQAGSMHKKPTGEVLATLSRFDYHFSDELIRPLNPSEKLKVSGYLDILGRQLRAEQAYAKHSPKMDGDERKSYKERLIAVSQSLLEGRNLWNPYLAGRVQDIVDEDRALMMQPPVTIWDRRPYEPLAVDAEEFWPRYPLFLADLQPIEENLASDITSSAESTAITRELIQTLFLRFREPLPVALDKVAPNAGTDLIRDTPILTDPARGGRLNPYDLTPRVMSREMYRELIRTYLEWPFRPSSTDLASQAGMAQQEASEAAAGDDEGD